METLEFYISPLWNSRAMSPSVSLDRLKCPGRTYIIDWIFCWAGLA